MKKLFLIEKEFFLREMIERTLKSKGWEVFSSDGGEDCRYLIEDLKPDILLIDDNSISHQDEVYLDDVAAEIPVVCIDGEKGLLKKPLSPSKLEEQLLKILENNKRG